MTKGEFMRELESVLSKLPQSEKSDALEYYNDYFAEAGIADDMLVPASMGNPSDIAMTLINEATGNTNSSNSDANCNESDNANTEYYYDQQKNDWNLKENKEEYANSESNNNTNLAIAIVLLVIFSPALIGVIGTLIGLLAALIGLCIGFVVGGVSLVVVAFFSSSLAGGIMLAGGGLFMLALGIASCLLLSVFGGMFIPWVIKECKKLSKWLMGKKEQYI